MDDTFRKGDRVPAELWVGPGGSPADQGHTRIGSAGRQSVNSVQVHSLANLSRQAVTVGSGSSHGIGGLSMDSWTSASNDKKSAKPRPSGRIRMVTPVQLLPTQIVLSFQ